MNIGVIIIKRVTFCFSLNEFQPPKTPKFIFDESCPSCNNNQHFNSPGMEN
jgi:hypothetical protein